MKTITIVLFASAVALSRALTTSRVNFKAADKDVLYKQKAIFELMQHLHQLNLQPQLLETANNYVIEQNMDHYKNIDAVKDFVVLWKHGFLPLNEVFNVYNSVHLKQVISLFHIFYYANDWQTFYNTILWARYHINPEQFVYALTVALVHRQDLQGLELPAIYEIHPEYFFNSEVIHRAQLLYQQGFRGLKKVEGVYSIVVPANYSGVDIFNNDEQRLSYFTEDIGLNAYNYYLHVDYPFWLGGQEYGLLKDRRGEYYLYMYQQLLARYYLERLSNDLGSIPDVSWYKPISAGFYPQLSTYYGYQFYSRENNHVLYNEDNVFDVEELHYQETRLIEAIEVGYIILPDGTHLNITTPEGIDYLGNLVQGNPDSVNTRFYKYLYALYKVLVPAFGKGHNRLHSVYPTVLERPEAQFRDPFFWQLYKRIIKNFYLRFYEYQSFYHLNEINFEGVKIESIEVDRLITYFDSFDADITNAIDIDLPPVSEQAASDIQKFGRVTHYQGEDIVIKARQLRLNHLPFKVSINVNSVKAVPAIVRVFLGPKYDVNGHVLDINENRVNYVLLDVIKYDLIAGNNVIIRESRDFAYTIQDRTTYFELYKWLWSATNSNEVPFRLENAEAHNGFPNRLLLPKGKKGGQLFSLFVHVSPYYAPAVEQYTGYDDVISTGVGSGARWFDSLSFGYPLDRRIDQTVWNTPNMYYHDVHIFHKKETEVN